MTAKSSNQSQKIEESKVAPRVATKCKFPHEILSVCLALAKAKNVKETLVVSAEPDKSPLPKKPTSAYIYFNLENYENSRKIDPNCSLLVCSKDAGARWATMTPQDKLKYQKLADDDKIRYDR